MNRAPKFLRVIEPLGLLVKYIGRSENPRVLVFQVMGIICPPVETGLTDLPNSRIAMALTAPSGTDSESFWGIGDYCTSLHVVMQYDQRAQTSDQINKINLH